MPPTTQLVQKGRPGEGQLSPNEFAWQQFTDDFSPTICASFPIPQSQSNYQSWAGSYSASGIVVKRARAVLILGSFLVLL